MSLTPIDPDAALGQAVDRFRLTKALEGSSGLLYVAELSESPPQARGRSTRFVVRLLGRFRPRASERRTWVDELHNLTHPALIPYVDSGLAVGGLFNGAYFFARRQLSRTRPRELRIDQVLTAASDLYSGLGYLHSRDIFHGALKPSNIHVAQSGSWRILDFGLVQLQALEGVTPRTFGERFAAPEVRDGEIGPSGDIYSVAALLIHMATPERSDLGPLAGLDWLNQHWPKSPDAHELLAVLRASLLFDPDVRPKTQAVVELLRGGDARDSVQSVLTTAIADREFQRQADRLAAAVSRRFGRREDAPDILQDAYVRLLAAAEARPSLAMQLSSQGALLRYLNTVLRNAAIDRTRSGQRYELLVAEGGVEATRQSSAAEEELDAADRLEVADQIESIMGRVAATAVRLRARAVSYEDIAEHLSRIDTRRRGAWTASDVFALLYRNRRAYPELEEELPPEDPATAQRSFADWLLKLGMTDEVDRSLVAGRLAGVALAEIAIPLGLSESALRRRFTKLTHDDPWIVMLFEPRPLPRQFDEAAAHLASWVEPPKVRLEQPWLDELRSRTSWLLEREGRRALTDESARDEVVASMLRQLELASRVREVVLDEPSYGLDDLAKMLELSEEEAADWLAERCSRGELIALSVLDRGLVVPAFQFDGAELRDLVRSVNVLLHADVDPWGAAGWWLQRNARLPGAASPASFMGIDPTAVRQIAESLGE